MRLAIIGTRVVGDDARAEQLILDAFRRLRPTLVVIGGAKGIDTIAALRARTHGIKTLIIRPRTYTWAGEQGFRWRNLEILKNVDHVVCIRDSTSETGGSLWTYSEAIKQGIPAELLEL